MDVKTELVKQAISHFWYGVSHDIFSEPVKTYAKLAIEALEKENGVTAVVRCKDCKYFKTRLCENEDNYDDWFCADGERKENE